MTAAYVEHMLATVAGQAKCPTCGAAILHASLTGTLDKGLKYEVRCENQHVSKGQGGDCWAWL